MAKRGLSGQLNLFDFWGDTNPEDSIVEMVSLVPEEPGLGEETKVEMISLMPEETKEPEEAKEPEGMEPKEELPKEKPFLKENVLPKKSDDRHAPVMHKEKKDKNGNILSEISYLDYNKVFIRNNKYQQGKLFEFEHSKEAVDFYISEMMKLTGEE